MGVMPPRLNGLERIRTPALVINLDTVDRNVAATLRLIGGDPGRWRPHLKTVKLGLVMRRLLQAGVAQAKVSTTLELEAACEAGFRDVLLAYPTIGPQVEVVRRLAETFPSVRISALVEDPGQVAAWSGSAVSLFIDLDSGMNRTGLSLEVPDSVVLLARAIHDHGIRFAGLHFYDGHATEFPKAEAEGLVHRGYDHLSEVVELLSAAGIATPEVVTAGTPAFPHALRYHGFPSGTVHRVSPGTVVYNDRRSLEQLPANAGYGAAVLVLSRVISHPRPNRICADAGHKAISADSGDPICEVLGHPEFVPRHPNEEHLPIDVPDGTVLPARGEPLWLLPTHVCPTVNNFDHAVVVTGETVLGIERVTARGRHPPLDHEPG